MQRRIDQGTPVTPTQVIDTKLGGDSDKDLGKGSLPGELRLIAATSASQPPFRVRPPTLVKSQCMMFLYLPIQSRRPCI